MPEWNIEVWQLAASLAAVVFLAVLTVAVLYGMSHPRRKGGDGEPGPAGWLRKLSREPALVRSLIGQAIALAVILGFEPDVEVIAAIEGVVVTLAAIWVRQAVTPVDDPDPALVERSRKREPRAE